MAKAKSSKKLDTDSAGKEVSKDVHISEMKITSKATGNKITEGDPNDPDLHDGQAWREGKSVGTKN